MLRSLHSGVVILHAINAFREEKGSGVIQRYVALVIHYVRNKLA